MQIDFIKTPGGKNGREQSKLAVTNTFLSRDQCDCPQLEINIALRVY